MARALRNNGNPKRSCTFNDVTILENPHYEELQMLQRSIHIDDAEESFDAKQLLPYKITNMKKVQQKVVSFTPSKSFKSHSYYGNVSFFINWNSIVSPLFYNNIYYIDQAMYKNRCYTRILITKYNYRNLKRVEIDEHGSPIFRINGKMHFATTCTTKNGMQGMHEVQISVETDKQGAKFLYNKSTKIANEHSHANTPSNMRESKKNQKYQSYKCFKFNTAQNEECPYGLEPSETEYHLNSTCPGMLTPIAILKSSEDNYDNEDEDFTFVQYSDEDDYEFYDNSSEDDNSSENDNSSEDENNDEVESDSDDSDDFLNVFLDDYKKDLFMEKSYKSEDDNINIQLN